MKTFLITGASGFIGSVLVDKLLNNGHKAINVDSMNDYYDLIVKNNNISSALSNDNYSFYKNDINDLDALENIFKNYNIDFIIHLAARAGVRPSIENPPLYEKDNGLGTVSILEMAKKYNVKKIILASSSSVYGNNKKTPFSEEDIVDYAISPYAATKKANEVMGHVYHKLFDIDMIFLRFFTVYGPRQRPDLAIHKFTKLILDDKPITMFGDGSSARDYTYIDDIVDGIIKSIDYLEAHRDVYEIINLGNNHPVKLKTLITTIENTINKKAIIINEPMQPGDVEITYADISKAKRLLNYEPKTSFEDGIKKFVEWYLKERGEK
ncbi:MAG: NAD-dependent epimerase/dehydratase family protein [Erysipelotrichia bacterium]|jgi:UDP-glucuronate 4-epimerase|nr:NAD-dependent epimerase/dehydratase family protein [Erysipelotrichia bacterium]